MSVAASNTVPSDGAPSSAVTETRAELLTPEQIDGRLAEASIVYVPLGALEFHGPHLPIGLDGLTAHGICIQAAERRGGVVLPTIYQGTGGEHSRYPWTIMMPTGDAIAENLRATVRRLAEMGVGTTVILSGHFADEQRAMLKALAEEWQQDGSSQMRLVATTLADREVSPVAPDHAGAYETLMLGAAHPDLVHLEKLPNLEEHPSIDPGDNPYGAHRHEPSHPLWGVFGADPRGIDLGRSSELLESTAEWIADLASID